MGRKRTGSLTLRTVGGVRSYYAQVTVGKAPNTRRESYCLNTPHEHIAKARMRRLVERLERGVPAEQAAQASPTLRQFVEPWLAARDLQGLNTEEERRALRLHIFPLMGDLPLSEVGSRHIRELLNELIAKGRKRNTLRNIRGVLNRIFKTAWQDELIESNPVERVPVPKMREVKKRRAILTDEEIHQLLACPEVSVELKMLVLLSRTVGGIRLGDLLSLDWTAFGDDFSTCVVPRAKTGTPQLLEVPESVRPFIAEWHRQHRSPVSGPVFPVRHGKRKGTAKRTRGSSRAKALRKALLVAGVTRHELHHETDTTLPVDFHSTRRAYSTALARGWRQRPAGASLGRP